MNTPDLIKALDQKAVALKTVDADAYELVNVLINVVRGHPVAKAFGAPGDWGYGTPIGDALAKPEKAAS